MRKSLFLIPVAVLFFAISNVSGQDYNNYNYQYFSGRLPSARSEALGRTHVVNYDGAFTLFFNPAGSVLGKGLNASFSYAEPFYLAKEASYLYNGITYHLPGVGSFGMSRFHLAFGEKLFYTPFQWPGDQPQSFEPSTTTFTFNYAKEILSNFSIGINVNYYVDHLFNEQFKAYPVDIGFLKIFAFAPQTDRKLNLKLGGSVTNVFKEKISIIEHDEMLPVILRAGSSFELSSFRQDYLPDLYIFGLSLYIEYEDILNYKFKTGFKFGSEISLFELLYLRLGYYSFKLDPGPYNGKNRLTDFTYGFGIRIPVNELVKRNIPLNVTFDFTSLEQPSYIKDYDDWDSFTNFSLTVNWQL